MTADSQSQSNAILRQPNIRDTLPTLHRDSGHVERLELLMHRQGHNMKGTSGKLQRTSILPSARTPHIIITTVNHQGICIYSSESSSISTLPITTHQHQHQHQHPPNSNHSSKSPTMSSSSQNAERIKEAHSTLYEAGLEMRNKVAGKEYVDTALSNATSDFARPMQEVCKPYHHPLPEIPPF